MAISVVMKNPQTGETKNVFIGVNWKMLFCPAIGYAKKKRWAELCCFLGLYGTCINEYIKGDNFLWFLLAVLCLHFVNFLFFNYHEVRCLIKDGFRFADTDLLNRRAAKAISMKVEDCVILEQNNSVQENVNFIKEASQKTDKPAKEVINSSCQENTIIDKDADTCTSPKEPIHFVQERGEIAKEECQKINEQNRNDSTGSNLNNKNDSDDKKSAILGILISVAAILYVLFNFDFRHISKILEKNFGVTSFDFEFIDSMKRKIEKETGISLVTTEEQVRALTFFSKYGDNPNINNDKLYSLFKLNSKYTDVQRENELKRLKGYMVTGKCSVYEVTKIRDNYYKITTETDFGRPGVILKMVARNSEEGNYIEGLKTGSTLEYVGMFNGDTLMRDFILEPSVLREPVKDLPVNKKEKILHKITISAFYIGNDENDPDFNVYEFIDTHGCKYSLCGSEEYKSRLEELKGNVLKVKYETKSFYHPGCEGVLVRNFISAVELDKSSQIKTIKQIHKASEAENEERVLSRTRSFAVMCNISQNFFGEYASSFHDIDDGRLIYLSIPMEMVNEILPYVGRMVRIEYETRPHNYGEYIEVGNFLTQIDLAF